MCDRDLPAAAGRVLGGWRLAALAFLTLPVALVGGVLAALVDGAELTLGSLIGFLALFALAARNGMVLIRRFQDLEREGEAFGPGAGRARGAGAARADRRRARQRSRW